MFGLGPMEVAIICVIVLLLFGNRLPSVMRSIGQGVVEFKKGLQGIENDATRPVNSSDKIEDQPSKPQAKAEAEHGSGDSAPR
jgi:sec-independent protein translocase protein TatA